MAAERSATETAAVLGRKFVKALSEGDFEAMMVPGCGDMYPAVLTPEEEPPETSKPAPGTVKVAPPQADTAAVEKKRRQVKRLERKFCHKLIVPSNMTMDILASCLDALDSLRIEDGNEPTENEALEELTKRLHGPKGLYSLDAAAKQRLIDEHMVETFLRAASPPSSTAFSVMVLHVLMTLAGDSTDRWNELGRRGFAKWVALVMMIFPEDVELVDIAIYGLEYTCRKALDPNVWTGVATRAFDAVLDAISRHKDNSLYYDWTAALSTIVDRGGMLDLESRRRLVVQALLFGIHKHARTSANEQDFRHLLIKHVGPLKADVLIKFAQTSFRGHKVQAVVEEPELAVQTIYAAKVNQTAPKKSRGRRWFGRKARE